VRKAAPEPPVIDPREATDWFQRLPQGAQEETRRAWAAREGKTADHARRLRLLYVRYASEAAGVFAFVQLWPLFPWARGLAGALVGAAVGAAAARFRAGPGLYIVFGGVGYLLGLVFGCGFDVFGYVFLLSCCGVLGVMHQLHRGDGTE
jgi:hypothetical protein